MYQIAAIFRTAGKSKQSVYESEYLWKVYDIEGKRIIKQRRLWTYEMLNNVWFCQFLSEPDSQAAVGHACDPNSSGGWGGRISSSRRAEKFRNALSQGEKKNNADLVQGCKKSSYI